MPPKPLSLKQTRALVRRMPFGAFLGLRATALHRDGITLECRVRDNLRNVAGVLHGGVTATLADAAVGIAIAQRFGRAQPATTVEMKINFLRPVLRGKLLARARLLRVGATLVVGSVDLFDAARQRVGAALVTYMFLRSSH